MQQQNLNSPLNDDDYLTSCINGFELLFGCNELAFIKDLSFRYVAATTAYSKLILLSDKDVDICGKYDHQVIQAKDNERFDLLLQKIRTFDEMTIHQKKASSHLAIALGTEKKPQLKVPLINKLKPLINPATGNVVGLLGTLEQLYLLNMPLFILKNSGQYHKYPMEENQIELTELQQITLFLLCNFLSAYEIKITLDALGMARSLSNVNASIKLLKVKFGVATKEALLEKALRMNYNVKIPERIFPEILYNLDEFIANVV